MKAHIAGVNLQALRRRRRAMYITCSTKQPGTDNFACKMNRNGVSGAAMQQLSWSY